MAKRSQRKKKGAGGKVSTTPGTAAWWLNPDWLWGLLLVAAVALVYSPVWWAGYVWDDDAVVYANPVVAGPLGLKEIWTTYAADICPFTLTTFWLEHKLWGTAPLPYHLVNVVLHAASAVLLWRVLRSLRVPGAWLGAALWALHPVEVESVAWITEMKNTESGLFFLLTIFFFVRYLKAGLPGERTGGSRNLNYGLTLLFAALAITSKTSTVILPGVLCLCAWWMEGRWHWRNLLKVAPILLLAIVAVGVSMWTQGLGATAGYREAYWTRSWPERLANAGDVVWFYLGKLIWPHPLFMVYPRWTIETGRWTSYLPLLAMIVVLFVLWLNRATGARRWFFVFAYFLVALFPVMGLTNLSYFRYSFVADHFQYLASMGPLVLAGVGLVHLADFVAPGKRWAQGILGAGTLLILGVWSWQYAWTFQDNEKLWDYTLSEDPNCWMAHNDLGNILLDKGQVDQALAHYREAVRINPVNADAQNNLGTALLAQGKVDEARSQFEKALELDPHFAKAYYNLGVILSHASKLDEAIVQFRKALEINPGYVNAHNGLAIALAETGHLDEAIAHFHEALRWQPDNQAIQQNLAAAEEESKKSSR